MTFQPGAGGTGNCWRRSDCQPEGFEVGAAAYEVYTKAAGYKTWRGRNCYDGAGGHIIDNDPVAGLSVSQCQARCDADEACSCVTYDAAAKNCWKRGACVPEHFAGGSNQWDTYVKQSAQPACVAGSCSPPVPPRAGAVAVSFDFEAGGYGCVLQTTAPVDPELTAFLASMQEMTARPLSAYSAAWTYLPQARVPIAKTAPPAASAPPGTVHVPRNAAFRFATKGVMIEGDDAHGVDVQFPWEAHPQREHSATLAVGPFFMDTHPATCANYSGGCVIVQFERPSPAPTTR